VWQGYHGVLVFLLPERQQLSSSLSLQVAVGALLGVVTGYLVGITWHGFGMPSMISQCLFQQFNSSLQKLQEEPGVALCSS